MAHLEVLDGKFQGKRIALKGTDFLVGREKGKNHLVLPDETVSRRHIRFRIEATAVTVEDLGTSNGTRVNGKRIEGAVALAPGDEVHIGATRLRFAKEDAPAGPAAGAPPVPAEVPIPAGATKKRTRDPVEEAPPPAPPARKPAPPRAARPGDEDRMQRYLRTIAAEDREKSFQVSRLREDLAQRAGLYQILVYGGLLLGGVVLFLIIYFLALQFVAEA